MDQENRDEGFPHLGSGIFLGYSLIPAPSGASGLGSGSHSHHFCHNQHRGQALQSCGMYAGPSLAFSFSSSVCATESCSFSAFMEKPNLQFAKTHSAPLFPLVNAHTQHFAALHLLRDAENT